ncbi:hypothetical protein LCGC14_1167080 [marine sediment metagenome]|uniref:HTH cro/C1-type domain-containing protein n=1 Tax=marine sediment metagenome TaxID=412755 RepID=A0A0F9P919_9ZZZZ
MSPAVAELDQEIDFRIPIAVDIEKKDHAGSFFFRGLASTDDIDLVADIITEDALAVAKDDLLKNPTIFLDHEIDERIGAVVETEFVRGKGLIVTGRILDSRPDIKEEIQTGSLSKLSVRATVLNGRREIDPITGAPIIKITRIRFKHVALVGNPANQEARTLEFWTEKSMKNGARFADKIQRLRKEHGWSLSDMQNKSLISSSAIKKLESREILIPNLECVSRLAKAFDMTIQKLVDGTEARYSKRNLIKEDKMGKETAVLDEKEVENKDETTQDESTQEENKTKTDDTPTLKDDLAGVVKDSARDKSVQDASAQMRFLIDRLKDGATDRTTAILSEMESVFGLMTGGEDTQKSDTDIMLDKLIGVVGKLVTDKSESETETENKDEKGKDIQKSEPRRVVRKGGAERENITGEVSKALGSLDEKKLDAMTPADALNELVKAGLL